VVKALLAAPGVDVNQAKTNGQTPLYGASYGGHTEVVKALLAAPGIDANQVDGRYGQTPLCGASNRGHTEVVKALLAVPGIDVTRASKNGRTPLSGAGNKEIKGLLQAANGIKNIRTLFHAACAQR